MYTTGLIEPYDVNPYEVLEPKNRITVIKITILYVLALIIVSKMGSIIKIKN